MKVIVSKNANEEVHDEDLPTTEDIIEQLQNFERDKLHDANEIRVIENDDLEIEHFACDGRVILRYTLWCGWDMDSARDEPLDGYLISNDEVDEMTLNNLRS